LLRATAAYVPRAVLATALIAAARRGTGPARSSCWRLRHGMHGNRYSDLHMGLAER
jgi:hypothetical protein